MKKSMRLQAAFAAIVSGTALSAPASAALSGSGAYSVSFQDQGFGTSLYSGDSQPKIGDNFAASKFFTHDFIQGYSQLQPIQVTVSSDGTTATVTGAGVPQPRTFKLQDDGQGNRIAPSADVLLGKSTSNQQGCNLVVGEGEGLGFFTDGSVTYTRFIFASPDPANPAGCPEFFQGLLPSLQAGTAPPLFQALFDSNALDTTRLAQLQEARADFFFDAKPG